MTNRSVEIRSRLVDDIRENLGSLINGLLAEDDAIDVILNPPPPDEIDGRIWISRLGRDREPGGFMSGEQATQLIGAVGSTMNEAVTADEPWIEGFLIDDRSRSLGGISPVSRALFFCIRRPASRLFTRQNYVDHGQMAEGQEAVIKNAVVRRLNILIVSGTGAGNSTLMNAVIHAIAVLTATHPNQTFTTTTDNAAAGQATTALTIAKMVKVISELSKAVRDVTAADFVLRQASLLPVWPPKMGIRVTSAPVGIRVRMRSVTVPINLPKVAGYVSLVSGEWRARRSGDTADRIIYGFSSRRTAATWLLEAGMFARPAPVALDAVA